METGLVVSQTLQCIFIKMNFQAKDIPEAKEALREVEKKIIDVEDRKRDYQELNKQSWRAEQGIRSICVMSL